MKPTFLAQRKTFDFRKLIIPCILGCIYSTKLLVLHPNTKNLTNLCAGDWAEIYVQHCAMLMPQVVEAAVAAKTLLEPKILTLYANCRDYKQQPRFANW